MNTDQLTPLQRRLIAGVAAGACVIAVIGFIGSYAAVRGLAEAKHFGQFAMLFPIGLDAGILVLLALDLLLTWLRMPLPLLRHIAWLLTAATIAFNGAAAWPDPIGVGMHAVIPVLFVAVVEAARHAVGMAADISADRHMESVRLSRWLLAPVRTFFLWRRMKLWELRSYDEVIALEQSRLVERVRLRKRYGWRWRSKAPVEVVIAYRLTRYGRSLAPAEGSPAAGHVGGYDPARDGGVTAVQPQSRPQPGADAAGDFDAVAASALAIAQPDAAECATAATRPVEGAAQPDALILDLSPMLPPHPEMCAPALGKAAQPTAQPAAPKAPPADRPRRRPAATHATHSRDVVKLRIPDADAQLLDQARELNAQSLREDGRKAPLRLLQNELGIGQRRAQRIQAMLPDTLAAAVADADADAHSPAKEA